MFLQSELNPVPDPDAQLAPLDIDYVHPSLHSHDDGYSQYDVGAAASVPVFRLPSERDPYLSIPVGDVLLSKLHSLYHRNRGLAAAHLLRARNRLVVDNEFVVEPTSDSAHIHFVGHKLDYRLIVSSRRGLSAILPDTSVVRDHNFFFNIDLRRPYREFNDSSGLMGFDYAHSMLFFGYLGQEEAWIAMAPTSFLDGTDEPAAPGHHSNSSRLSARRYRMLISFLAHVLSKNPEKPFICPDPYGISLTDPEPRFTHYFSIMFVDPSSHLSDIS